MATTYTIDASVFINAFNPAEVGHADSHKLLAHLREQAAPLIAPTLLLPEVAAAIRRGRGDEALARQFAAALSRLPHLVLTPLDQVLAQQAGEIAARYSLRGSDAVYAAVALRFGSTLVTLDREQRERVAAALPTCTPVEALVENND
ncbi:MAG: tRNA(fMet)-specific endonuclease VapC [Anaerolineae bacterium]|nr:tRNA(fMet)-specific endonuclease VapC [Anaerolineae bacterium]